MSDSLEGLVGPQACRQPARTIALQCHPKQGGREKHLSAEESAVNRDISGRFNCRAGSPADYPTHL